MTGTALSQLGFDWRGMTPERESMSRRPSVPEMRGDDYNFLRSTTADPVPTSNRDHRSLPLIDLFCGVGGLSLGFHEAARATGLKLHTALAIDTDEYALGCYRDNLGGTQFRKNDIREVFDSRFDAKLSKVEKQLRHKKFSGGILTGGPPCQGHSDLNNSTRRNDPKNSLYYVMARAARVFEPVAVIIENVPAVIHDRGGVVTMTKASLQSLGYYVSEHVFDLTRVGVPQTRKRHLVVACVQPIAQEIESLTKAYIPQRTLAWAIRDLEALTNSQALKDVIAVPNRTTKKRIDYLFDHNLYELPNSLRPACHRLKNHSYRSIYGRLSWNAPAQTITRGFYCMCMGRYVHPSRRRTLTAHEAARLQFFPDWFRFDEARTRTRLATLIGNAVPSKLGFVVGLKLFEALGLS